MVAGPIPAPLNPFNRQLPLCQVRRQFVRCAARITARRGAARDAAQGPASAGEHGGHCRPWRRLGGASGCLQASAASQFPRVPGQQRRLRALALAAGQRRSHSPCRAECGALEVGDYLADRAFAFTSARVQKRREPLGKVAPAVKLKGPLISSPSLFSDVCCLQAPDSP